MSLAYPERRFAFLSDQAIVDGWDLPNVEIRFSEPGPDSATATAQEAVTLCPRWLGAEALERWSISSVFQRLEANGFRHLLPVRSEAGAKGVWQVKGDRFHRPDAPEWGEARALSDIGDPHGCGLVFQPRLQVTAHHQVVGRRTARGTALGVMWVHAERFFRDDVIQAAQTVRNPFIEEGSLSALEVLGYEGFFTFNWIDTPQGALLSSFRPVPRAGLRTLREHGADLLLDPAGTAIAGAGGCFVAQPHYASYTRLEP